jgi:hypothetical protein
MGQSVLAMKEEYAGGTPGASAGVLCKFERLWKAANFEAETRRS